MTLREKIWEKQLKICEIKKKLAATDYKAIKFACDEITAEEYEPVRKQRVAWRAEINAIETEIKVMKGE